MTAIDIEQLLTPISAEAPGGDDIEYDPAFREMEAAALPKPPPEFGPDKDKPPEPPDWPQAQRKALELLARGKHLRPAVYLVRALLATQGFDGLGQGLKLLRGLLEGYWETLYPQLDPDDPFDPSRRNILEELNSPGFILNAIRLTTPLFELAKVGRFTLRDLQFADQTVKLPTGPDKQPTPLADIVAEFIERDEAKAIQAAADAARNALTAVSGCIDEVDAIQTFTAGQAGMDNAPRLSDLTQALKDAARGLQQIDAALCGQLAAHGLGEPPPEEAAPTAAAAGPGAATPAARAAATGEIVSREDVIRWLDKICDYYKQHEPSSPVPLLLQRARRLVSKDFIDILRDLAPNGLPQFDVIRGAEAEEK